MLTAKFTTYDSGEAALLAGLQSAIDLARRNARDRVNAISGCDDARHEEIFKEELRRVKIVLMCDENAAPSGPPAGSSEPQPPAATEPPAGAPTQYPELTPPAASVDVVAHKRGRRKAAEVVAPVKDSTDKDQQDLLANHGIPSEAPKPEKAVAEVTVVGERKESRAAQAPAAALEVFPTTEAVQESIKDAYNRLVAKGKGQGAAMNEVRGVLAEFKIDRGAACPEKERAALIARLGQVGA
jgi:hypothetical protein